MFQAPTWLTNAATQRIRFKQATELDVASHTSDLAIDRFELDRTSNQAFKICLLMMGADVSKLDFNQDHEWLEILYQALSDADYIVVLYPEVATFIAGLPKSSSVPIFCIVPDVECIASLGLDTVADKNSLSIPSNSSILDSNWMLSSKIDGRKGFSGLTWNGETLELDFTQQPYCQYLGLYPVGRSGALTVDGLVSIRLPYRISGNIHLQFRARSVDKVNMAELELKFGEHSRKVSISPNTSTIDWGISVKDGLDVFEVILNNEPEQTWLGANAITIENITVSSKDFYQEKPQKLTIRDESSEAATIFYSCLSGDYLNENWADLISAFCFEFRDNDACCLILSVPKIGVFAQIVMPYLSRLGVFHCRVLVYELNQKSSFWDLLEKCDYFLCGSAQPKAYLNNLMALKSGKPIIAMQQNGMQHYVSKKVGFPYLSFKQAQTLSSDNKFGFKPFHYTPDWASLCNSLRLAHDTKHLGSDHYQKLCAKAKDLELLNNQPELLSELCN